MNPPEPDYVYCPVCNRICELVVINENNEVIGCDKCLKIEHAIFWKEEQIV